MKGKYHYEYYLICVDLCNGGCKRDPYRSSSDARLEKNFLSGIWEIKKYRVYE